MLKGRRSQSGAVPIGQVWDKLNSQFIKKDHGVIIKQIIYGIK